MSGRLSIRKKTDKLKQLQIECVQLRSRLKQSTDRNAESAESHRITFKAMADRIKALEKELSETKRNNHEHQTSHRKILP